MLCDLMLGKWGDRRPVPIPDPDLDAAIRNPRLLEGLEADRAQEYRDRAGRHLAELDAYIKWAEGIDVMLGDGIAFEEVEPFQGKLRMAQKFFLTPAFAEASLSRLATPETVVRAKEWFRLTHDPMWMEWRIDKVDSLRMGILLLSVPTGGESPAIMCYVVSGVTASSKRSLYNLHVCRIFPETLRKEGDDFTMDMEDGNGVPLTDTETFGKLAMWAYDFVIRLNSPRITDILPPEDLSRINRKRAKLGRRPLSVYQVVDLNKTIKAHFQQSICGGDEGVRFHWRRGHFKARRTGLFWWNPHTAGRKVYGEVRKEYVA